MTVVEKMTRSTQRIWLESSPSEMELAHGVAQDMCAESNDPLALCQVLEGLALRVASSVLVPPAPSRIVETVERLWIAFPSLGNIDISEPFPKTETDLTANFFSRLAYEVSAHLVDPTDHGVVGTPAILAEDMVALAAAFWLAPRVEIPIEDLFKIVLDDAPATSAQRSVIGQSLAEARWYDPCVGGGVFPVAILLFLDRWGVQVQNRLHNVILGRDRDPIAVTATNIRVSMVLSRITGKPYAHMRRILPAVFNVGDSLEQVTEQGIALFARSYLPISALDLDLDLSLPSEALLSGVDIVVGNPPYVRADRMDLSTKAFLKKAYPSVASGPVDLYNFFIAHGLLALNPDGILCYISPASFQKSKYGSKTRQFIDNHGALQSLFDFNELPVFNGASIHASVYTIAKDHTKGLIHAHAFRSLPTHHPLLWGMSHASMIPASNAGVDGWHIHQFETASVLDSLGRNAISLDHYTGGIFSGIKAGHKPAYHLPRDTAEHLCADEQSRAFIKPLLRPVSIRAWRANWDGTHMAFIKKGEIVPPESLLMGHLKIYESELCRRSDVQGDPTWYGLRTCAYYGLFGKPKIIFPDIASECRFAMDTEGYLIPDGAFLLPVEDYFLLGLLNSCVAQFYFRARCNSIGNVQNGGRLRFKKTYVENFPVPLIGGTKAAIHDEIAYLAQSLVVGRPMGDAVSRINTLSLELYNVPERIWHAFLENY